MPLGVRWRSHRFRAAKRLGHAAIRVRNSKAVASPQHSNFKQNLPFRIGRLVGAVRELLNDLATARAVEDDQVNVTVAQASGSANRTTTETFI